MKWLHCTIHFSDNIIQIEEDHSQKLPLSLPLLNYECCMETSFLSNNDNETKLLLTELTQLAKARINSLLAVTAVHQQGQLQLALHIPGAPSEVMLI